MTIKFFALLSLCFVVGRLNAQPPLKTVQMKTPNGIVEGVISRDDKVKTFKGIPYAAPPVGPLRWKPPQPVAAWQGVRKTVDYPARCMQGPIYKDMVFHDSGPSEDCLYVNLWMPNHPTGNRLPVMVWIHGGGYAAGASSEPRQDGGQLSKRGVVVVSLNYRLGLFGFFALPELANESPHHAAGNYGLLDQLAALQWVHDNIALFGGDPENVTIFGESAGSLSVSALMASPLSRQGFFKQAIGESGAYFGDLLDLKPLGESEKADEDFAQAKLGTTSLAALRAKSASELLDAQMKQPPVWFTPNIDGYFLPRSVQSIYAAGEESHVPLLAGWNADEGSYHAIFKDKPVTADNFAEQVKEMFGKNAPSVLHAYPASNDIQAKRAAGDLASDQFIAYVTWKWIEMQSKTGGRPVYRYKFEEVTPAEPGEKESRGAYHSSEIDYVFNVLGSRKLAWTEADHRLSDLMATYWSNFAKTGNPNGEGLPEWPPYTASGRYPVMHLNGSPHFAPDTQRSRYELLDSLQPKK